MTETILEEAARITSKDRQEAHGHPRDHFAVTVALINARFAHKLLEPFKAWEWPIIMVLDKVGRGATSGEPPMRDSLVDIAGYARTCERVLEPASASNTLTVMHAAHCEQCRSSFSYDPTWRGQRRGCPYCGSIAWAVQG